MAVPKMSGASFYYRKPLGQPFLSMISGRARGIGRGDISPSGVHRASPAAGDKPVKRIAGEVCGRAKNKRGKKCKTPICQAGLWTGECRREQASRKQIKHRQMEQQALQGAPSTPLAAAIRQHHPRKIPALGKTKSTCLHALERHEPHPPKPIESMEPADGALAETAIAIKENRGPPWNPVSDALSLRFRD